MYVNSVFRCGYFVFLVQTNTLDQFQLCLQQTALGRAGQPEDIGGAIASLLSADSGWINAQRVEASGGMFV